MATSWNLWKAKRVETCDSKTKLHIDDHSLQDMKRKNNFEMILFEIYERQKAGNVQGKQLDESVLWEKAVDSRIALLQLLDHAVAERAPDHRVLPLVFDYDFVYLEIQRPDMSRMLQERRVEWPVTFVISLSFSILTSRLMGMSGYFSKTSSSRGNLNFFDTFFLLNSVLEAGNLSAEALKYTRQVRLTKWL